MFDRLRKAYHKAKITALQMAIEGRDDAEKQALTEQTMAEWHAAEQLCCQARAAFQQKRKERLEVFIYSKTGGKPAPD